MTDDKKEKDFHDQLHSLTSKKPSFGPLEVGIRRADPKKGNGAFVPYITVSEIQPGGTNPTPDQCARSISPTEDEARDISTITLDCRKAPQMRMRVELTRKGNTWQVLQTGPIKESQMVEPESTRRNLDLHFPPAVTLSQKGECKLFLGQWQVTGTSVKHVPTIGTTKVGEATSVGSAEVVEPEVTRATAR